MQQEKGGFFEQIQGHMNPVIVEHYYGPRVANSGSSFPCLVQVMTAHVVMLSEEKIIPEDIASKLLSVMLSWENTIPELDPGLEDLYINLESLMTKAAGGDVCGYLPVARSRNDVEAAMWRIELREKMYDLADSLILMTGTLHTRIKETADYVFPGYTYNQQAQPITMGHHLLGISAALLRSLERVLDCVARFNKNPLGAAAMAGTSYPIDRVRTAELMGFDGVWEHTGDAVSSADYMLEAAGAGVSALVTLARLAEDIIWWCSNEAGFADLPNDMIDSSSIMPQKRNPVICASVRSQARLACGRYAGICAACSVGFQASRDVTAAWEDVLACVNTSNSMCRISEAYTKTLIFRKEAMEQSLYKGFSNTTELADSLVLQGGLSFRAAHKIVGGAVSQLFQEGKGQDDLTWSLLDSWSHEITGRTLPITKEQVSQAKDFRIDVERRSCLGGTSQSEIARMLALQRDELSVFAGHVSDNRSKWAKARERLRSRGAEIAGLGK